MSHPDIDNNAGDRIAPLLNNGIVSALGGAIRERTKQRVDQNTSEHSMWFPHGPLGFGGHYSKKQILEFLKEMSDVEIGVKGLKLRFMVSGIVTTILIGGYGIS